MKVIESILPVAIDAVRENVLKDNEVPKEFNGYISSFGASITNSGLLPTLVFFSQGGKAKGDRTAVIKSIEQILIKKFPSVLTSDNSLLKTVKENIEQNTNNGRLLEKIELSAIALKLAIRIFPKSKKESNHD